MPWIQAGAFINNAIRLSRPLGAGGMGSVWVADHLGLNTQVVVKFMSDSLSANAEAVARFKREAASASAVKSPHVVQMLDYGITPDGTPFIVMELLEGEDLRHRLARVGVLPPREIALIVTQAAKALGRAHERGVVHRDVKPDNIFLCDVGDGDVFVKVLDFGIAKTGEPTGLGQTKTGAMLGTPYYMSPEQVMGAKSIDHRTDLWSLGIVAFEALTGARVFEAETIGAISVMICHGDMPRPSTVRGGLSPAVDAWFARACARDVNARFSSARELAEAFEAAVNATPVAASPMARTEISGAYLAGAPQWAPPPASGGTVLMSTTSGGNMAHTAGTSVEPTAKRALPLALIAAAVVVLGGVAGMAAFGLKPASAPTPATASTPTVAVEPAAAQPTAKKVNVAPVAEEAEPSLEPKPRPNASASATAAPAPTVKVVQPKPASAPPPVPKPIATQAPPPPPAVEPKPAPKPQPNDPTIF